MGLSGILLGLSTGCTPWNPEDEFQKAMEEVAGPGDRAAFSFINDLRTKGLCKLLEPVYEKNAQELLYFLGTSGHTESSLPGYRVGDEIIYDLQSYQVMALNHYGLEHSPQAFGVSGSGYSGLGFGPRDSILDLMGKRFEGSKTLGTPLLSRIPLLGSLFKTDFAYFRATNPEGNVQGLAIKKSVKISHPVPERLNGASLLGLLNKLSDVKTGSRRWLPNPEATASLAETSNHAFGASGPKVRLKNLMASCPSAPSAGYLEFGSESDAHADRAKRMAKDLLRASGSLDPLGHLMSIYLIALGVVRDGGGYYAVCKPQETAPALEERGTPGCRSYDLPSQPATTEPATVPPTDCRKGADGKCLTEPSTPAPACTNGTQDGDEDGIDCGGSCPDQCPTTPPPNTCTNGSKDGDESDVDCGGSCSKTCALGKACGDDGDCSTDFCSPTTSTCAAKPTTPPPAGSCTNGTQDGDETDIDCGGSCPDQCVKGKHCAADDDCTTDYCDPGSKHCIPKPPVKAPCENGKKDGDETDIDCGGSCTKKCAPGKTCAGDGDCDTASGWCQPQQLVCGKAPADPNAPDEDIDGIADDKDNCPKAFNPTQKDTDFDGLGNACDPNPDTPDGPTDKDKDGVTDDVDNCPEAANTDQTDTDGDKLGDACDADTSPATAPSGKDTDGDLVPDQDDNCPTVPNGSQRDSDGDGIGDACQQSNWQDDPWLDTEEEEGGYGSQPGGSSSAADDAFEGQVKGSCAFGGATRDAGPGHLLILIGVALLLGQRRRRSR